MSRIRWFRVTAVLFGAFNAVGGIAALGAGAVWAKNVSQTQWPPGGFLRQAATAGLVAVLAFWSARAEGARSVRLWWSAVALSFVDLGLGFLRNGPSGDDLVDLVILAVVAAISGLLLHAKGPAVQGPSL